MRGTCGFRGEHLGAHTFKAARGRSSRRVARRRGCSGVAAASRCTHQNILKLKILVIVTVKLRKEKTDHSFL